jgi:hypothetical protein
VILGVGEWVWSWVGEAKKTTTRERNIILPKADEGYICTYAAERSKGKKRESESERERERERREKEE